MPLTILAKSHWVGSYKIILEEMLLQALFDLMKGSTPLKMVHAC